MPSPKTPPPRIASQSARLMDSPFSDYYTDMSVSPDTDPRDSRSFVAGGRELGYSVEALNRRNLSIDEIISSTGGSPQTTPQRVLLDRLHEIAQRIGEREHLTNEQAALLNSRVDYIEADLTAPVSQTKEPVLGDSGLFIDDDDDDLPFESPLGALKEESEDGTSDHLRSGRVEQPNRNNDDDAMEAEQQQQSITGAGSVPSTLVHRQNEHDGVFFSTAELEAHRELIARVTRATTSLRIRYEEVKHLNDLSTLRLDSAAARIIDLQAENEALRRASALDRSELFYLKLQLRASDLQVAYRGLKMRSQSPHTDSVRESEPDNLDRAIDRLREEMRTHSSQSPSSSPSHYLMPEDDDQLRSSSQAPHLFTPPYRFPSLLPPLTSDTGSIRMGGLATPTASPGKRRRMLRIKRPSIQDRAVSLPITHISPVREPSFELPTEESHHEFSEMVGKEQTTRASNEQPEENQEIGDIPITEDDRNDESIATISEVDTVEDTEEIKGVTNASIPTKIKTPWQELWDGLTELSGFQVEDDE